jgi:beta-1,4-N-acetylglucosaminyltransferase
MIFVTVGTTRFDELLEAVDRITPRLNEDVIIQAGKHTYTPRNCEYFAFENSLREFFQKADIIVAHGGAGTTFEVLSLGKMLISVENPHVLEGHQGDLLRKLSQDGYLIWCKDLSQIEKCIENARNRKIRKYERPDCGIAKTIAGLLG